MATDGTTLDVTDDILGLLVETLSITDRILQRADPRINVVRIRNLAHHLEEEIIRHWAERDRDAPDNPFDDDHRYDLDVTANEDDIPF